MGLIKSKCCIILGCFLFHSISHAYSQCDIEMIEKQKDTLIFHSTGLTDSLRCYVRVYLTYSNQTDSKQVGRIITDIEIKNIELRTKSSNQKLRIFNCLDTVPQCICDTLDHYIRLYYSDPNRLLTAFELTTLDQYSTYRGNIRIGLSFSSIYIYSSNKNRKRKE